MKPVPMLWRNFQPTQFDPKGIGPPEIQDMVVTGFRWKGARPLRLKNGAEIHRFNHWQFGWFEVRLERNVK